MLTASFKSTDGTVTFVPTGKLIQRRNSRRPALSGSFTTIMPLYMTEKGWRQGVAFEVPRHAPRPLAEALYYAREAAKK